MYKVTLRYERNRKEDYISNYMRTLGSSDGTSWSDTVHNSPRILRAVYISTRVRRGISLHDEGNENPLVEGFAEFVNKSGLRNPGYHRRMYYSAQVSSFRASRT